MTTLRVISLFIACQDTLGERHQPGNDVQRTEKTLGSLVARRLQNKTRTFSKHLSCQCDVCSLTVNYLDVHAATYLFTLVKLLCRFRNLGYFTHSITS